MQLMLIMLRNLSYFQEIVFMVCSAIMSRRSACPPKNILKYYIILQAAILCNLLFLVSKKIFSQMLLLIF